MKLNRSPRPTRGATLVTVLVLLLVMTLIGVVGIRGTLMEERMSANLYDRSLAFQAAEAALRVGENIAAGRPTPEAAGACAAGLCGFPVTNAAPFWESKAVWDAAPSVSVDLGGVVATPKYIVELLADGVPPRGSCVTAGDVSETACTGSERRYRITARSEDGDSTATSRAASGRSSVTLQSIYAVP
jgi:type IV pilus assembly protein PilX